ncbi:MAG: DUF4190 domain-containing protein [Pyrinomonadaceae bacterium]
MTRACPKCGQMNPPDAAFCLNCASSLGPTVGGTGYQQQSPPHVGGQGPYVGSPPQYGGGQQFGMQGGGTSGGASQRAIISLVLAIVGLVCCGYFTGIPAAIMGWLELDAIKSGKAPKSGKVMAQIGLWGGIAVSIIYLILTVLWLFLSLIPVGF